MRIVAEIIHVITGFLVGFLLEGHPSFSIILFILFMSYELSEWVIKRDRLFPEIREFTVGYVLGFIAHLIMNYIYTVGGM